MRAIHCGNAAILWATLSACTTNHARADWDALEVAAENRLERAETMSRRPVERIDTGDGYEVRYSTPVEAGCNAFAFAWSFPRRVVVRALLGSGNNSRVSVVDYPPMGPKSGGVVVCVDHAGTLVLSLTPETKGLRGISHNPLYAVAAGHRPESPEEASTRHDAERKLGAEYGRGAEASHQREQREDRLKRCHQCRNKAAKCTQTKKTKCAARLQQCLAAAQIEPSDCPM